MRSLLDGEPKKIIFIDRCSTFSANQLNLIGSSGAEAVIPLDLAHHGYDLAASSKGALRISDSEAEQAQLVGAVIINRTALPQLIEAAAMSERASVRGFSFYDLIDLILRAKLDYKCSDVFPIQPGKRISKRKFELRRAARSNDGLFSTVAVRPISRQASSLVARTDISPNFVTAASLILGICAAGFFATAQFWANLAGIIVMYLSLLLDCVDGEVARLTERSSTFGAWFDGFTDRIKEHLLIIGLAIGAARSGEPVWLVASLAILAITIRHLAHFAFVGTVLIDRRDDDGHAKRVFNRPGLRSLSWHQWFSRVLHAPVSERWLILMLGVVTFGPKGALWGYTGYVLMSCVLVAIGWYRRSKQFDQDLTVEATARIWQLFESSRPPAKPRSPMWWFNAPATMAVEGLILLFFHIPALAWENSEWIALMAMVAVSWARYEGMYRNSDQAEVVKPIWLGNWYVRSLLWISALILGMAGPAISAAWWLAGWSGLIACAMFVNAARTAFQLSRGRTVIAIEGGI